MNRKNKEYPLKQYKEYDSFEVKILEYDLLLKNIEVTEKFVLNNSDIIDLSIPIIFIKNKVLKRFIKKWYSKVLVFGGVLTEQKNKVLTHFFRVLLRFFLKKNPLGFFS